MKPKLLGLSASVLKTIKSVVHPSQREEPGYREFSFKDITGKSSPSSSSTQTIQLAPPIKPVVLMSESTKRVIEEIKH